MREKADLVDKTENLEHIIMQLQGESDTIGKCCLYGLFVFLDICIMVLNQNDVCKIT